MFPLFKRSAADLSGAALRVHITVAGRHASQTAHPTEVDDDLEPEEEEEERLNSPGQEGISSRHPQAADSQSRPPCGSNITSAQHSKSVQSSQLTGNDTFMATVSVDRAMHLSLKGEQRAGREGYNHPT